MKTKKNTAPADDSEQSARFVDTAKAVGASSGRAFADAFKKLVPKRKRAKPRGP